MALICDTGPLFAAMDRRDPDHEACAKLLEEFPEDVLVPAPVLVELDWLAGRRLGPEPFELFIRDVVETGIGVVDLLRSDYQRVRELLPRYRDLELGFVDAAVVAIVERLGERKVATLDHRHFSAIRPAHVDALELLPAGGI